jgi:hypothetical protein
MALIPLNTDTGCHNKSAPFSPAYLTLCQLMVMIISTRLQTSMVQYTFTLVQLSGRQKGRIHGCGSLVTWATYLQDEMRKGLHPILYSAIQKELENDRYNQPTLQMECSPEYVATMQMT